MSRLFWVRHGPTHQKAFTGHRDVPADLSDHAALARLSAALPGDALVISSDLSRAVDTASAIAAGRRRLPHEPALREFDFGDWDGLRFDEVAETWPDLSRRYWEAPGDVAPPNGESWNAAANRVSLAIDDLLARHRGRDLVIVAHFGTILTQLQRALAVSAQEVLSQRIDPLSLTIIDTQPNWQAASINQKP